MTQSLEFHDVVSDVKDAGRALFFQGVTPGLWDAEYVTASCAAAPAGGVAEKCSVPLKCVASTRLSGRDGVGLEEKWQTRLLLGRRVSPVKQLGITNFSINKF